MTKNDQRSRISAEIEKDFESTVLQGFMPGLLHTFANPLNGILGRSHLLRERVKETIEAVNGHNGMSDTILERCNKIARDADLIARESETFFDLFNKLSGKFYRLNDTTVQKVNLSDFIEKEVAFLEFYLDFRHNVDKKLLLNWDVPDVRGTYSCYSLSLFALIRRSIDAMRGNDARELVIVTDCDESYVSIDIKDTGTPLPKTRTKRLFEALEKEDPAPCGLGQDKGLFNALFLLKGCGGVFKVGREGSFNVVTVCIPYKNNRIASTKRQGAKQRHFPEVMTLL
ncbi:MAG: hypothetical protein PHY29_04120 [Syntrophales bacterium]|nr:hypothetical protein [Syntrophales bacterium]